MEAGAHCSVEELATFLPSSPDVGLYEPFDVPDTLFCYTFLVTISESSHDRILALQQELSRVRVRSIFPSPYSLS